MGSFSSWAEFWPSGWGLSLFVFVCLLLVVTLIIAIMSLGEKSGKSGLHVPYGTPGGQHSRQHGDPGDQPGYSPQKPYGTGVNALVCGGPHATKAQNAAANALKGAALEANIQAAMDDYLGVDDIALDKSLGSQYLPGPAGGAPGAN